MKKSIHPFATLFQVSLSIHHLNKVVEKKAGLSVVQWYLLKQLMLMPGIAAQALAKAVGVHPSTLTQSLRRLQRKELVFMCDDSRDSRKKIISLTRKGKEAIDKAEKQMHILDDSSPLSTSLQAIQSYLHQQIDKCV